MEAEAKKNVTTDVKDLCRGDVVIALRHIQAAGDVRPGTLGVVFEEQNAYKDGGGPMVRFMNMCCCNVYHGDVVRVSPGSKSLDIIDTETGEVKGTI
jgi:hypothetical protein